MPTNMPRSIAATNTPKNDGTISIDATGLVITLVGSTWESKWGRGDALSAGDQIRHVASKDSSSQLTLAVAFSGTLQSSSGNPYTLNRAYTSLNSWEAAAPAGLTTNDLCWEGIVYKDGGDFDEILSFATSDSGYGDTTKRIWLYADANNRHNGTENSGARIKPNTSATTLHVISSALTEIEDLEFSGEGCSGTGMWSITLFTGFFGNGTPNYGYGVVKRCLFYKFNCYATNGPGRVVRIAAKYRDATLCDCFIFNCGTLAVGRVVHGVYLESNGNIYLRNNTILGKGASYSSAQGTNMYGSPASHLVNNIIMDWNGGCLPNSYTTEDYNLISDGTGTGAHDVENKVSSNQFISIVSGSEDLHLKTGNDAQGQATDLGTTYGVNYDIDNFNRDSIEIAWDIGAHQKNRGEVSSNWFLLQMRNELAYSR